MSFATIDAEGPIRVVLVGAGNMGRHWLDVIAQTPEITLVGIVDLDLELAQRTVAERRLTVSVGASLAEVVNASTAQAVIDVTVPPAHHAVNTEALFLGLPVLCEKPIAPTVADALSLIAAEEVSGQLLMTSQSRRYYPALAELREFVGTLGEIGAVTTEFFKAPHFGGFRDEMDHPLLVDMAIHAFDVARYLLHADPVAVDCRTFNPSWSWYRGDAAATAVFEFADGARYTFTGSWCSPGLETSWNGSWRISGALGSATWDGEGRPTVEYVDDAGGASRPTGAAPSEGGRSEIAGALDEWVHALRTGSVPSGDVHANVFSLAMVEGAVRSAETLRRVSVDEVLDDAYAIALEAERRSDVRAALAAWGSARAHLVDQEARVAAAG
ncbi:Gfo/Idh/MocA family protein [Curtobacterium ammoniigenes]|uniref:Gfo/Idh/MocA family protein n=1 Tax=Curtobacterium ammoniigenes TaxID=395387 RepID=UPI000832A275|nr:Gfo/Idh/MocA family oxidoreductase [Curtobacterium ammoniigenes]